MLRRNQPFLFRLIFGAARSGVGRLFQRDMGTVINIWVVEERRKMVRRKKMRNGT